MATRLIRLELNYRYTHELVTERELFTNRESPDEKAEAPKYEGVANPIFEGGANGRIRRKRADMVLIPRNGKGARPSRSRSSCRPRASNSS